MGNMTYNKVFLLLFILLAIFELVNNFRLVQDKIKDKPKKKITTNEKISEKYIDKTVILNITSENNEKNSINKENVVVQKSYVEHFGKLKSINELKSKIDYNFTKANLQQVDKTNEHVPNEIIESTKVNKSESSTKLTDVKYTDSVQLNQKKKVYNVTKIKDNKEILEPKKDSNILEESIKIPAKSAHLKKNFNNTIDNLASASNMTKSSKKQINQEKDNAKIKNNDNLASKSNVTKSNKKQINQEKENEKLKKVKTIPFDGHKDIKKVEIKDENTKPIKNIKQKIESKTSTTIVNKIYEQKTHNDSKGSKQKRNDTVPSRMTQMSKSKDSCANDDMIVLDAPTYFPNYKILENEECAKHCNLWLENLKDGKMWAMKMFDSSAKMPANILKGNTNQLGDYDQCTGILGKISDKQNNNTKIFGKYCLANIDIEATADGMKLPVNLAQGRAFIRSKSRDPGHFIPRFTTINWGICIPAACSSEDVQRTLENYIEAHNETFNGVKFKISVESEQCYTRKPVTRLDKIAYSTIASVALIALLLITTIAATFRDLAYNEDLQIEEKPDIYERIFLSFSLKRTTRSLLQESESEEIKCIHGIRAICSILLYVAHKLIPIGHTPYTNRVQLTEISNNPLSMILRMSVLYTDTFLLLSGVLTAYHMSKDMEKRGHIPWFNRIFSRILRLAPSLIVVLIYYAYIMEGTGEGPLWNTIINVNSKLCQQNWWKNVLFIQNLFPFEEMCATHTHQLALDMQLYLMVPILVWLLYKKPFLGILTTIFLHSFSVIIRYYSTINYRLSVLIYHGISLSKLYRTGNLLYASSLHRATPYIAGVGVGVLLRQMKSSYHMPKILSVSGWLVTGYFVSWTFYAPSHITKRSFQYDIFEAAQFAALCSLTWSLALSWIIFACYANYEGYLNSVLSSRPMILLSKLSYTMYLTQFIVFFYNVGSTRTSSEFSLYSAINVPEFIIILLLSTSLFLVVELPAQKIKNILMKQGRPEESINTKDNN